MSWFNPEYEVLVIVTQSCSVVSRRFDVDPNIEAMAAQKLPKFQPGTVFATGKNQRKLHLRISEANFGCMALELDINRRSFFDRKKLLDLPLTGSLDNKESKDLAGWLARSYTRVALPDELVVNMKVRLLPTLEKILKKDVDHQPLHSQVNSIYLRWKNSHQKDANPEFFLLYFNIICKSDDSADALDQLLINQLDAYLTGKMDNIHIENLRCGTEMDTFLSDLNGYDRFSEWDSLTTLGEVNWYINTVSS